MPIFTCEKCECETNSTYDNNYHSRWLPEDIAIWPMEYYGKLLCGLCLPDTYINGEPVIKRMKLIRENGWVRPQKRI